MTLVSKELTYLEKVSFIHWLLNNVSFDHSERSVITFLLSDSEILERVVFVDRLQDLLNGKEVNYAIEISSQDTPTPAKFIELYEDIYSYSPIGFISNFDDGIDDYLPLEEKLYVQIEFPNKKRQERYTSLFEEVSSVESKELTSIMKDIYAFNIDQEINKAIDNNDEERLIELGKMLAEVKR